MGWAKAKWLLRYVPRAVFVGWLRIDGGVPHRTRGRNCLRAGHRVPGCYRGIGLESAGRGHNGRTDPNHAETCQRQPEAAPQALLRREKAEVGMEILGRGHGDTPTNLSPIPPGPKLGQLCRLVELVAAAMLLARRRQRGLDGRRASTHTIACDRLANGSREPLWCFRNRRWLATSRSRPGAVPPRG